MPDQIFNASKGRYVEKIADANTNILMLLLSAFETEANLVDRLTLDDLLTQPGNTECVFTNYTRITGITGTVTIDNTNNWVDVDIPDQVINNAGGAVNETVVKVVTAYEDSASDAGRIPMSHHDASSLTNGNNLTIQIDANGIMRTT